MLPPINKFLKDYLVPYVNYHRPCYYAEVITDEKTGKQRKKYPYANMMTPYEKFKSLPAAEADFKVGLNFNLLDALVEKQTDLDAAKSVQMAREILFKKIAKDIDFLSKNVTKI